MPCYSIAIGNSVDEGLVVPVATDRVSPAPCKIFFKKIKRGKSMTVEKELKVITDALIEYPDYLRLMESKYRNGLSG